MLMLLFEIVAVLLVAGLILYFLNVLPGIDPTMKALIRAVIIIAVVIFLLWMAFSLLGGGVPMHGFTGPCR